MIKNGDLEDFPFPNGWFSGSHISFQVGMIFTVDGRNPKQPPGVYKTVLKKIRDKLPTSTG